jgi:hypothetical protein
LTVLSPWFAKWGGGTSYFLFENHSRKTSRKIPIHCDRNLYTVEADRVAEYIRQGKKECPDMSWADTLGNMKVLDQWRKSAGAF